MLSSISVPESGLLETVRLHSTSLVHSPVSCKPRCPLRSLSVRNVGRARASASAEDNGRRQRSAQGRTQELVSKIIGRLRRAAPIAQSCVAARLPENQERRRGGDAA